MRRRRGRIAWLRGDRERVLLAEALELARRTPASAAHDWNERDTRTGAALTAVPAPRATVLLEHRKTLAGRGAVPHAAHGPLGRGAGRVSSRAPRPAPAARPMTPLDFSNIDQSIPRSLPLLDGYVRGHDGRRPLAGVNVLMIQHQLGNHFPQAKALLELGLERSRLTWIDVPYTARPEVRDALIGELGLPRERLHVHAFRVLDRYPPYQLERVRAVVARLLEDPPERLVVLDDGAYFLEACAHLDAQPPAVAVVEQTTRGLIKLEESAALRRCAARLPLVDVARSRPKLTLEPPFIGRAVCDSLSRHVARLPGGGRLRCLVLGFGAIGRRVAEYLPAKLGCDRSRVHVHDTQRERLDAAARAGFPGWERGDARQRFDLVVGCSGRRSFTLADRDRLADGAVLASASSGTVELSRQEFIELAEASALDDISVVREGLDERDVHSDLAIRLGDRTVTFVNGGFPVNFDGRVNCIPGRYIQPTQTMMVAATVQALQALDARHTGRIELDPGFCAWLDEAFRAELGDESALLGPDGART